MWKKAEQYRYILLNKWWIVKSGLSVFSPRPRKGPSLFSPLPQEGPSLFSPLPQEGPSLFSPLPREGSNFVSRLPRVRKYYGYSAQTAPDQDWFQQRAGHELRQYFLYLWIITHNQIRIHHQGCCVINWRQKALWKSKVLGGLLRHDGSDAMASGMMGMKQGAGGDGWRRDNT
jgi:hypothetical protein